MSYEVESKTLPGGHRVAVVYDEHPESPREWDNLGTVVLVDRCRYNFGDEQADQDEVLFGALDATAKVVDRVARRGEATPRRRRTQERRSLGIASRKNEQTLSDCHDGVGK